MQNEGSPKVRDSPWEDAGGKRLRSPPADVGYTPPADVGYNPRC